MRVYVDGTQQGGSAGVPGTPAEVLLDAAEPNSIVTLDASGVGSTIPQSSIPTLPAAPSSVLLDVGNQGKLVSLASTTGVGASVAYSAAVSAGVGQLAATLGDFPTGNGAGGAQLASVNPNAVLGVLGLGQPTTLAAQARATAKQRRGPIAMRTVGVSGAYTASTAPSTMPMIARGSSGALTIYSPQAGGYASMILFQSGAWGSNGWYISGGGGTPGNVRVAAIAAVNEALDFPTAISTVGWHTIAWAIASNGMSARYSIDGSAAATVVPSVVPMTPTPRDPNAAVYVGSNGSSVGVSPLGLAYIALWSSILSDSDLVALSSSPSAGAPDVDSISGGDPAWEWAAAAFVGSNAVNIGTATYTVIGSTEWWMP